MNTENMTVLFAVVLFTLTWMLALVGFAWLVT
jgi:hypothetical protein